MKAKLPFMFLLAAGLALTAIILSFNQVNAAGNPPAQATQEVSNDACLACHNSPGKTTQLPSGEVLYIGIDPQIFDHSVHGEAELKCVSCHTDISGYPHPPIQAQTRREFNLNMVQICQNCHQKQVSQFTNDAHQEALAKGNENAAVCTDCHGSHDVQNPSSPRSLIPKTCEQCHSQIYNLYKDSVHGAALIGAGNPDVPSCATCHNAHNVQGPSNTAFRLWSPQICARCHANTQLMEKYGINTNVFNTYLSDFHGTTVTLYQAVAPGQQPNKPVCIDCHGVHDIAQVNDPNSTVIKQNILTTCRKCHPDATANFPSAWLSHYSPSPQHAPLVYFANLFYLIFIPAVIIPMAIFVATDISRRFRGRRRNGTENKKEE